MRPQIFDRHFAALAIFCERPQPHVLPETVRNIGVQFDCYFAAASLGLDDDCQGNPFAARVRVPPFAALFVDRFSIYSMISKA